MAQGSTSLWQQQQRGTAPWTSCSAPQVPVCALRGHLPAHLAPSPPPAPVPPLLPQPPARRHHRPRAACALRPPPGPLPPRCRSGRRWGAEGGGGALHLWEKGWVKGTEGGGGGWSLIPQQRREGSRWKRGWPAVGGTVEPGGSHHVSRQAKWVKKRPPRPGGALLGAQRGGETPPLRPLAAWCPPPHPRNGSIYCVFFVLFLQGGRSEGSSPHLQRKSVDRLSGERGFSAPRALWRAVPFVA